MRCVAARDGAQPAHGGRSTHRAACPAPPAWLQYLPWLGMMALKRVGPARARALRDGKSGYDMAALLRDGSGGEGSGGKGADGQAGAAVAAAASAGS